MRVAESMTIKVKRVGTSAVNVQKRTHAAVSPVFNKIYSRRFINYKNVRSRYPEVADGDRMIVICPTEYMDAMKPFITWKNMKGIKTTMHEFPGTIGSSISNIEDFIQEKYDDEGITYVILVGDYEDVPSLIASMNGENKPSDPSYILLNGNDKYPDAFIGRFSASNPQHVAIMVDKVLKYEKEPDPSSDWYEKGIGIASSEGNPKDYEWMDDFREVMMNYNYTKVDQVYQGKGASASQVTTGVNEGRSWINYMGHGNTTGWSTSSFKNSHVASLNNAYKLPVVISVACLSGNFKGTTCFAEAWTQKADGKGAIIFMGASISQSWTPPQIAQKEMVKLLCEDKYISAGAIIYNGEMAMLDDGNDRGTFKSWTLFGDPSLMVTTKKPVSMTVDHPESVGSGTQKVKVTAPDGARVCLYSESMEIQAADFVSGGSVELEINVTGKDPVYVTVTNRNTVPYFGEMSVGSTGSIKVKEPNNGDDVLTTGETYEITWESDVSGKVKIQLVKGDDVEKTIATVDNSGKYKWTVSKSLDGDDDYKIRIVSEENDNIKDESDESFVINNLPVFKSKAVKKAAVGKKYSYTVKVDDKDGNSDIELSGDDLPSWLELEDDGDGRAVLKGTPKKKGEYDIVIEANDQYTDRPVTQEFTLEVDATSIDFNPNPFLVAGATKLVLPSTIVQKHSEMVFQYAATGRVSSAELKVFDHVGNVVFTASAPVSSLGLRSDKPRTLATWNLKNYRGSGAYVATLVVKKADGSVEAVKALVGIK